MNLNGRTTMRAMRLHPDGRKASLRLEDDIPIPHPAPGEVLVKVRACGLNQVDLLTRGGEIPKDVPLPHISGTEVAGDIAALGEGVSGWAVGAAVVVDPILSCGHCRACISGNTNMCRTSRVFGVQTQGGYAQFATVPARQLHAIPEGLGYAEVAAIAVTGPTAWHMLRRRADIRIGDDVLIIAGGSGIGVLGIQIAKLAGARVIATAGSEAKMRAALELGADHVVNHSEDGWAREVRALTGGKGVDLVFEHVGEATWEGSLHALARGGRLVTCGGHSGFDVKINLWHLFVKEQTLIGSFAGSRQDFLDIMRLAERSQMKQVVQEVVSFEDLPRAQEMLQERRVFGKLVLDPWAG